MRADVRDGSARCSPGCRINPRNRLEIHLAEYAAQKAVMAYRSASQRQAFTYPLAFQAASAA